MMSQRDHDNDLYPSGAIETSRILSEAGRGHHMMAIYDSIGTFRELYSEVAKRLVDQGNDVMLILSYYETTEDILRYLGEKGVRIIPHQENSSITIVDAVRWHYNYEIIKANDALNPASTTKEGLVKELALGSRQMGKTGMTIVADMGALFLDYDNDTRNWDSIIGLDESFMKELGIDAKVICCYHHSDIDRLNNAQRTALIKIHDKSLLVTAIQNLMFEEALAVAVNEAMKVLGKQVSAVVTNHLREKYSISPELMSNNPEALGEALEQALDDGSRIVERKILRTLYEKVGSTTPSSASWTMSDFNEKILEVKKLYEKQRSI